MKDLVKKYANRPVMVLGVALAGALVIVGCGGGNNSDTVYEGERIEIINPFSIGGGTGSWLAFLIPYLQEFIPGNPEIEQVSQSGGGGLNGPNYFENQASDGFTLLASSGSNVFPYIFNQEGVNFEYNDYTLILGSPVGGVFYSNPNTVADVDALCDAAEATSDPLVYGAINSTGLDIVLLYALNLLGFSESDGDINFVTGVEGRGNAREIFVQEAVNIDYQTAAAYNEHIVPLVNEGTAEPLFTVGILDDSGNIIADPTYPDLPTFADVYEDCNGSALSGVELDAYTALLVAGFAAQKNLWIKSDVDQAFIDALLEGARLAVADPDFDREKVVKVGEYDFSVGQVAQSNFNAATDISDAAYAEIRSFLDREHDTQIPAR